VGRYVGWGCILILRPSSPGQQYHFFYIKRNWMYFVCAMKFNIAPAFVLELLSRYVHFDLCHQWYNVGTHWGDVEAARHQSFISVLQLTFALWILISIELRVSKDYCGILNEDLTVGKGRPEKRLRDSGTEWLQLPRECSAGPVWRDRTLSIVAPDGEVSDDSSGCSDTGISVVPVVVLCGYLFIHCSQFW